METVTGSLYDSISEAIVDGELPKNYSLPKKADEEGGIIWADGALDGVMIYHMGVPENDEETLSLIADAVRAASEGDTKGADELFLILGKKARAIGVIDALQSYIMEHREELSSINLYKYAAHLLVDSDDTECVKTGFSLLELMVTDDNAELKNVVRELGLSDEFTLFALFLMMTWTNGNDEIFGLARKVHGWGRIHAVEKLSPDTEEIRRWLMLEGVHNNVIPAYSALVCWYKSGADEALDGELTKEEFNGIRDIINGLLDEEPITGLSGLDDCEDTIMRFLGAAEKMSEDDDDLETIRAIQEYFEKEETSSPEVVSLCKKILCE